MHGKGSTTAMNHVTFPILSGNCGKCTFSEKLILCPSGAPLGICTSNVS